MIARKSQEIVAMETFVLQCSKSEFTEKRKELFNCINGEVFFPLSLWPPELERAFWQKPIGDGDTFKLIIFFVENGCPPTVAKDWIISSTFWDKNKTIARSRQIDWILDNREKKCKLWFYFDLHLNKYVYLDGKDRLQYGHTL